MTDRHCLQNAALTEPPCRRVYIATSCATGMRIGENRGSWPETSWSTSMALSSPASRSSFPLMGGFRSLSFQDSGCRTLAEFQEKYPASDKDVIDFYSVNEPALHALYFSRSEEQDKTVGCVGHLRGDFGSGKQFYTTWWPHQQDALNTPEFKADIDRTVNWLREQPDSPLRDFDSMKRYCNRYEQICAIKGALLPSCGFMVKTKQYVYMLRCTPVKGDYQFYIYCYQRKPFEKAQKEQQKNDRLAAKKRAEPER